MYILYSRTNTWFARQRLDLQFMYTIYFDSYVSAETYRHVHTVLCHLCMILTSLLRLTGVHILYLRTNAWFARQRLDLQFMYTIYFDSYVCAETYRHVHTVLCHLCMIFTSLLRLTGVFILYSVGIYAWFESQF